MSRENVEVMRQMYEAFNRGDFDTVAIALDPNCEANVTDAFLDAPTVYRGRPGFRQFLEDIQALFDQFGHRVESFEDAGDSVLVITRSGGIGRRSGAEVRGRFGHLWRLRDRQPVEMREFKNPDQAREALRLRE